jgi:hypothetical protein
VLLVVDAAALHKNFYGDLPPIVLQTGDTAHVIRTAKELQQTALQYSLEIGSSLTPSPLFVLSLCELSFTFAFILIIEMPIPDDILHMVPDRSPAEIAAVVKKVRGGSRF